MVMGFKNKAKQLRFDLLDPKKGFGFKEKRDVCSI